MTGAVDSSGWVELAERQINDAVEQARVQARVSIQLQAMKYQFGTLGVAAEIVEKVLGDPDHEEDEDKPNPLGKTLDQYL
jgi:hypothetical protein